MDKKKSGPENIRENVSEPPCGEGVADRTSGCVLAFAATVIGRWHIVRVGAVAGMSGHAGVYVLLRVEGLLDPDGSRPEIRHDGSRAIAGLPLLRLDAELERGDNLVATVFRNGVRHGHARVREQNIGGPCRGQMRALTDHRLVYWHVYRLR